MAAASKRNRAALITANDRRTNHAVQLIYCIRAVRSAEAGTESSTGGGEASTRDCEQTRVASEEFMRKIARIEPIGDLLKIIERLPVFSRPLTTHSLKPSQSNPVRTSNLRAFDIFLAKG